MLFLRGSWVVSSVLQVVAAVSLLVVEAVVVVSKHFRASRSA